MAGFEQEAEASALIAKDEANTLSRTTASPVEAIDPPAPNKASTLLLCVCENIQMVRREVVPILMGAGYEVELVEASARRPPTLSGKPYRLLLFDIGSKSDSQYQVCAQTRLATELPILLLLRGAARHEAVRGFQAGADAYVLMPFDPRELLVRLDALVRRCPALPSTP